jgi:hypothetical protein
LAKHVMSSILTGKKSQIDALALLGHANYHLSLRRRELLKPFLKKEYASLCSSQTAVSALLFGEELQTQLTAIRASNRISNTAIHPDQRSGGPSGANLSNRNWRFGRGNDRSSNDPYSRWNNRSSTNQQKPRRGASKKQ